MASARVVAALVLCAAVAAAAPGRAHAADTRARAEARERFDRGIALFNEGDNAGALAEFTRAYDLVPNRLVLFNIGMVYAAMGRPVEATDTLDRVLADAGPLAADKVATARHTRDEQARRVGTLEVTTNVPASIEVDGVDVARAPLASPLRIAGGTHVVAALAPGHLPVRREVTVAGEARATLALELAASASAPAQLAIHTDLPDADVVVDGQVVGKTPLAASVSVAAGRRVVEVRRPGYLPRRQEITLGEGASGQLDFDWQEDPAAQTGQLMVLASEPGAQVVVDGRSRGDAGRPIRLPGGVHRLRVEHAGFEPTERSVTVGAGTDASIRVTLAPTAAMRSEQAESRLTRRRWGWIGLGAGAAVLAGGVVLAVVSQKQVNDDKARVDDVAKTFVNGSGLGCDPSRARDADACDARWADVNQKLSDAQSQRTIGYVVAGAGAAIAAAGAILVGTSGAASSGGGDADMAARPVVAGGFPVHGGGVFAIAGRF